MRPSGNRIIFGIASFIVMLILLNALPDDARDKVLPIILIAAFVQAAIRKPPIAIAILLYYSMILGGWLILAAAPVTVLLARRYQRQRLNSGVNSVHIRRTMLAAMTALVATLPFAGASLGPWSNRNQSATRSASPLIPEQGSGQQGVLQRFARWLGFGDDGGDPFQFEPLQPVPIRPPEPDDPFNWWVVAAIVAILALLALAWWLWTRRTPRSTPAFVAPAARPLARLEAVGERVGRPRAPFEGVITYGQVLARRTGDTRLATAGPLVSSQVYESAFANPNEVDANLHGLESAPPPAPPKPPLRQRLAARVASIGLTPRVLFAGLVLVAGIIVTIWVVVPRLGDLDENRTEFGLAPTHIPAA